MDYWDLYCPFESNGDDARLGTTNIRDGLLTGDVTIATGSAGNQEGNITWESTANLDYDGIGNNKTLTLEAANNIDLS